MITWSHVRVFTSLCPPSSHTYTYLMFHLPQMSATSLKYTERTSEPSGHVRICPNLRARHEIEADSSSNGRPVGDSLAAPAAGNRRGAAVSRAPPARSRETWAWMANRHRCTDLSRTLWGVGGRSPCHDGKVATPSTTRVVLLKLQEGNKEPNDGDSV